MANLLTIARPVVDQALRQPRQPIRCPVGWSRWDGHHELLIRPPGPTPDRFFQITADEDFGPSRTWHDSCAGMLTIGREWRRGQAYGLVDLASGIELIDRVKLVGPGMHQFSLRAAEAFPPTAELDRQAELRERWSRTIGALQEETWQRLTRLTYGIVGLGRTGSIVAQSMAAGWGVERLVLIDPDRIEAHNFGEMVAVTEGDLGRWKVDAVAERVRSVVLARPVVSALQESITHVRSLRNVQVCDVLFSSVDHDGPRLGTAILAALFCKPHLDIATGIHGVGDRRQMGADIRLTLPGRCLLCLGGLADLSAARRVLESAELEAAIRITRDWRRERAGSLRSLNQLAASMGLRLWEDFVAERVRETTWIRLEFDAAGLLQVSYPLVALARPCPLCGLMGTGEEGLDRMPQVIGG
jgi:hypothetical protein